MIEAPAQDTRQPVSVLFRFLVLGYGVLSYVVFLVVFLYAIGFVGNLIVPKSIDSDPQVSRPEALAVDLLLLGLFAGQHSIMARASSKRR
jgi:methanethiol S-methyltransferase